MSGVVEDIETAGFVSYIPLRNIWLLMLYASDMYRDLGHRAVDLEENPDRIPDLAAEILCHAVRDRLARNLSYGYLTRHRDLTRIRGRVDLLDTCRRQLLSRGLVACRFDELTTNTPRNRLVKAALIRLRGLVLRDDLAHECRVLAGNLERLGVTGPCPSRPERSAERFGRHDADDRRMVAAADLALSLLLPTEASGSRALERPDRDIHWLRQLFESAVTGLYEVNLPHFGWRVNRQQVLRWPAVELTDGISALLPTMRTDITLDHRERPERIVIDTKFTTALVAGYAGTPRLRSGYIYQIYAYLRSQERKDAPQSLTASGMLLHPAIDRSLDESVTIQNHRIRFVTIDLTLSGVDIRDNLIRLVVPDHGQRRAGDELREKSQGTSIWPSS
jgi:5-methylcytosine-specific restriction enzyme subunit McrC